MGSKIGIHELACKLKVRFQVRNGIIASEDLYDLSLESLDEMAIPIQNEIKDKKVGSLLSKRSKDIELLQLKYDLIEHVFNSKVDDKNNAVLRKAKETEIAEIDTAISEKKRDNLSELSLDELLKKKKKAQK